LQSALILSSDALRCADLGWDASPSCETDCDNASIHAGIVVGDRAADVDEALLCVSPIAYRSEVALFGLLISTPPIM
jgi:hypothetical protein